MRANFPVNASPRFRVPSDGQIEGVHDLTQEHTRNYFRSETWFPTLIDRQMRRSLEASGSKTMADRIQAGVVESLEHQQPAPLPEATEQTLKAIADRAETRHSG